MEARYRRVDGSYRYVMTRRVVERDEAGEPLAFVGVALDVTERVEQRQQAEELARRLEAASHAAGIGLWTTAIDPPETDWNAQTFAIFDRFPPPRVPSLSEWLRECVHADDRERVAQGDPSLPGAVRPGGSEIEFRILRRDGSVRWVVMRADIDTASVERRRVLGVVIDVTEQHAALEALRDASERSALIARHAGIGMWEARLDGSAERWDEQMFHLRGLVPSERAPSREERLAMVHPDDLPRVLDPARRAERNALPTSYEFRVRLPDGSWRWLASRSALVERRARTAGAPGRRQLGRHRGQAGRAGAPAGGARRARDPRQVAVPLAHEPRAAHAAQRGARLHPAAADRGPPLGRRGAARQARPHPRRRRPPALADQRRARPLEPRIGRAQAGARRGRSRPAGPPVGAAGRVAGGAARRRRRDRRGPRRGPRRRDPAAPGADQPAVERDQVQPARRPGRGARGPGRRQGGPAGARHRARPDADAAGAACSSRSTASAPRAKASKAPASA